MHGHVHGVAAQAFNPYTQVAAAKASAAQEAAATRRKLQRIAADLAGTTSEDAAGLIDAWGGSSDHRDPTSSSHDPLDHSSPSWSAGAAAAAGVEAFRTGKAISYYV